MSYILDALKKADAERERGAVPGLRAQPVVGEVPISANVPSSRRMLWVVTGAVGVAALGGAYWLGTGSGPTPTPTSAPATMASAAPQATVTQPVPVVPPPPAPVVVPAVTAVAIAPPTPAPSPKPAAPFAPTPSGAGKPPASKTPSVAQPAAPIASAPLLSELPADIRGQIPAITIQGSVYSETPTQRLLLANGQVLSQGAALAPDLTVQEIGKGQSEFSFRGTRFRVNH